ncbi:hypothetical protein ENBRE01_1880 [Enteropsectra breve]|nr:hypothetical protein ENBRE01_1880 [Enteropsectra breve]
MLKDMVHLGIIVLGCCSAANPLLHRTQDYQGIFLKATEVNIIKEIISKPEYLQIGQNRNISSETRKCMELVNKIDEKCLLMYEVILNALRHNCWIDERYTQYQSSAINYITELWKNRMLQDKSYGELEMYLKEIQEASKGNCPTIKSDDADESKLLVSLMEIQKGYRAQEAFLYSIGALHRTHYNFKITEHSILSEFLYKEFFKARLAHYASKYASKTENVVKRNYVELLCARNDNFTTPGDREKVIDLLSIPEDSKSKILNMQLKYGSCDSSRQSSAIENYDSESDDVNSLLSYQPYKSVYELNQSDMNIPCSSFQALSGSNIEPRQFVKDPVAAIDPSITASQYDSWTSDSSLSSSDDSSSDSSSSSSDDSSSESNSTSEDSDSSDEENSRCSICDSSKNTASSGSSTSASRSRASTGSSLSSSYASTGSSHTSSYTSSSSGTTSSSSSSTSKNLKANKEDENIYCSNVDVEYVMEYDLGFIGEATEECEESKEAKLMPREPKPRIQKVSFYDEQCNSKSEGPDNTEKSVEVQEASILDSNNEIHDGIFLLLEKIIIEQEAMANVPSESPMEN